MHPISNDLSSIFKTDQLIQQMPAFLPQVNTPELTAVSGDLSPQLLNDIAELSSTGTTTDVNAPFDMAMNDLASYKDILSAAKDGISRMKTDGQNIQDIVAQAQQANVSQDLLDKMQAEVDSKIMDINIIKDAAESNGVNPLNTPFSLDIPDLSSLMGIAGGNGGGSVTSYNMDLSMDIDGVTFSGSASVAMTRGDNGAFQLAFDVTLNYDLSGLSTEGITSEGATDIINNFLSMLSDKEGSVNNATKLIDTVFEKIFDKMNEAQGSSNDYTSSSYLGKQIMQSQTIMNSINMNQMPMLAQSLL